MQPWIEVKDLGFSYASRAVHRGLSITLGDEAPVLAVVGPSGAGKTSLLKLLAGHETPQRGSIRFSGELVTGPSPARPVVYQHHNLFPWMTAAENVAFGLKCVGTSKPTRTQLAHALLERMGLRGVENMYPAQLSGGMRQRVGLARAIIVNPKCILMDEPFSALDSAIRQNLVCAISAEAARGTKFVLVTHDLADAVYLSNTVLILDAQLRAEYLAISGPSHPRPLAFRASRTFGQQVETLGSHIAMRLDPYVTNESFAKDGAIGAKP